MVFPLVIVIAALAAVLALAASRRSLTRWVPAYARSMHRRAVPVPGSPVHLLLCIADHYEPRNGGAGPREARARVDRWAALYPQLFDRFRDSDGRPPQHTFFYPLEQYDRAEIDALADLCRAGFGEIELHLHHDRDNADSLRQRLLAYKRLLAERHGLLARNRDGEIVYGFIHGDWALDNSAPGQRGCGVDNELQVLVETGCYADFTNPAAPDPAQSRVINSIYYATGRPGCRRSHDSGVLVGAAPQPPGSLMIVQGPLLLNWRSRKAGLLPRIENGCLQMSQPPQIERLDLWLRARVQVPSRPDWFFVKLHAHGATEESQFILLGDAMVRFHEALADRAANDRNFHYHYITAREMYNLVRAAEAGWRGAVSDVRDFEIRLRGAAASGCPGRQPLGLA